MEFTLGLVLGVEGSQGPAFVLPAIRFIRVGCNTRLGSDAQGSQKA